MTDHQDDLAGSLHTHEEGPSTHEEENGCATANYKADGRLKARAVYRPDVEAQKQALQLLLKRRRHS